MKYNAGHLEGIYSHLAVVEKKLTFFSRCTRTVFAEKSPSEETLSSGICGSEHRVMYGYAPYRP